MKAAILGTSGYTGLSLIRYLSKHNDLEVVIPASSSKSGIPVQELDPGLGKDVLEKTAAVNHKTVSVDEALAMKPDVVFAALPHIKSAEICEPFFGKSVVIDLSADLRIKSEAVFEKAYKEKMPRPDLAKQAVFGLCEWYRPQLKSADIIANPGCYPTCSLLPTLPLLKAGLIGPRVIVNAISGISGAGKKLADNYLFCERTENTGAYLPGRTHRHAFEIEQELLNVNNSAYLLFTPHLAPLKRGMTATIICETSTKTTPEAVKACYAQAYGAEPFIQLRKDIPQSRDVWGTNRCDISWHFEGDYLYLFSAIDNLVKGAVGNAIQAMNIRFGFEETTALKQTNEV
ncbi:MAG: N-acetyl-gamma-glutamyl-phosphate reductase [Spirochaetales bacterium]|nr:N-acetyl-gamma-glutamyl-phosphate reductase [Spirochaetales bacterium]